MPEDGFLSMRDYTLQMKMLDYLHGLYPRCISACTPANSLPDWCRPKASASTSARPLNWATPSASATASTPLRGRRARLAEEMAEKHVMVEVNLSSNEGILGVKGVDHPFPIYRAAHVPVALSTDDEGVSRIDITHEYVRAAIDYRLTYRDLKELARTGMEHSFLSGAEPLGKARHFYSPRAPPAKAKCWAPPSPAQPAEHFWTLTKKPRPSGSSNSASAPSRQNIFLLNWPHD